MEATRASTPVPSRSSRTTETPESLPDPPGGSGNPAALKRMRGKGSDPDKDRQIEELRKAWFDAPDIDSKCLTYQHFSCS